MTRIKSSPPVGSQARAKRIGDAQSPPPEPDDGDNGRQTVDEVVADVDAGKISAQEALDAERAADKPRSTLIEKLESRIGDG